MCGICLIFEIKICSQVDLETLNKIKQYNQSFLEENNFNDTIEINDKNSSSEANNDHLSNFIKFEEKSIDELYTVIQNRGPDYSNIIESTRYNAIHSFKDKFNNLENYKNLFDYIHKNESLIMMISVLSLRGVESEITEQPIVNNLTGNILQYNGEIYKINKNEFLDPNSNYDLFFNNDGLILSELLNTLSSNYNSLNITNNANELYSSMLFDLINSIESDHALVYYDKLNQKIILNRDMFGKRSLLIVYFKLENIFIISSVLTETLSKLDPDIADIIEVPANSIIIFDLELLDDSKRIFFYQSPILPSILRFPLKTTLNNYNVDNLNELCYELIKSAVFKRVCNLPEIVKLNKEADKSIAVLYSGGIDSLLIAYMTIINIPEEMNITLDLINLSFDKQNAPDRNSGLIAYYELKQLFPNRKINLILVDKNFDSDVDPIKERVKSLIYPKQTHMDFNISTALKLATKLEGVKVIDELFMKYMNEYFEVLDKVNSSIKTDIVTQANNKNYSNNILSKKLPIVDYASFIEKDNYKSKSKIVLSGLGADEFFGGYARYKTSYQNGGSERLKQEMTKDIDRIWTRNFGRDDRACSDNGIEMRFPFFDYDLINFLAGIDDIKKVTNFEMNRGEGEKIILRQICQNLGFKISFSFEKRAIQFGTKLAKETNLKKYGSNRKANGKAQFK